ncbi:hypothetical protein [Chitinophaga nivalis]|uniref:Phage protein n=1 Tax=Chitinophaga nivalis TaxID=2991709 RepID=A0ABT3IML6_9BACT|nr:hypothetical protein [Chitinophaga nivalis]MCW3465106.1 hypothetical protein [Chitinophaga nivalis]MCW3485202.1 hypothetical protein [Chitinophaga nivalis]
MSVTMDIIRALDPAGLERFKIRLDVPVPPEKIGEVWTIRVVPFEKAEPARKDFNTLFDNNKSARIWVTETKEEALAVVAELYQHFGAQLGTSFDPALLKIDHLPATGRFAILIHVKDVWE